MSPTSTPRACRASSSTSSPGSRIHTDGWQGYTGIGTKGFRHRVTVTRTSSEPAHIPFPGVHRVASLLMRWCLGTHQGGMDAARVVLGDPEVDREQGRPAVRVAVAAGS